MAGGLGERASCLVRATVFLQRTFPFFLAGTVFRLQTGAMEPQHAIRRFFFGNGWAFDTGSRLFHAASDPPNYRWLLVEFTDEGTMPRVGEFPKLDDCEKAISWALAQSTVFEGDYSEAFPLLLKKENHSSGSHFFTCRRRSFHIAKCWRESPWGLTEELPLLGFCADWGSTMQLEDAKAFILKICGDVAYRNKLSLRYRSLII